MSNDSTVQHRGWIGVDLDGTLAHYDGWKGPEHIGEPVPAMVRKVKAWLEEGRDVRIFTARIHPVMEAPPGLYVGELAVLDTCRAAWDSIRLIRTWSEKHLGSVLTVTCCKDYGMVTLYDDRCVYVFPNQGLTHEEERGFLQAMIYEIAIAHGITIETGMGFKQVAELCAARARAGAPNVDRSDAALALVDAALDALNYAMPQMKAAGPNDLHRAKTNLERALPILRSLAGR